ncbi:winged helix-turn-helix domain-containing tetratricopeptide repeat protein [Paraburkholderia sp. 40]|uniref:winged helix-turn-helix domain-containing tetratricopeptide repeat protein n=1 Tax=Paraburkholderia sp. 40 TaxID=2991059 RepID=UPI003D20388C
MNAEIPANVATMLATDRAVVPGVLRYPGFEVDIDRGELRVDGRAVPLRPKTFALLTYLAKHPGRLLARDEIIQSVWRDVIVTDDSLVQCVSELRAALGDQRQKVIRTVPRRGYMLELAPVEPTAPDETGVSESYPVAPPAVTPSPSSAPVGINRRRFVLVLASSLTAFAGGGVWAWWRTREATVGHRANDIAATRRTIAVLPFTNLSGDASQAYFADGITADVIADVSRLPDTLVIAQNSTQMYRDTASDAHRAAQELQVPFVVTGSVWRSGGEVRIAVRLVSAESGAVLWADTLVYPNETQWNWRRDVGPRVAYALDIRTKDVIGGWGTAGPEPREAIEHTMRGFATLRRASARSEFETALREFREALTTAPKSASAWAGLSLALSDVIFYGHVPYPQDQLREAKDAADRALALDGDNPYAHVAQGKVLYLLGQLDAAQDAFETCLALNPSFVFAHVRIGLIRIELGHAEEAQRHVDMALRLGPKDQFRAASAHLIAGIAQFHLGNDDQAYAELEKMVTANPRVGFAYLWMAAIDALHGRDEKAHENLERYKQLIEIHTISGLKTIEHSKNAVFLAQRERFYDGLRKAGMPE